jgi:hypothetical protein
MATMIIWMRVSKAVEWLVVAMAFSGGMWRRVMRAMKPVTMATRMMMMAVPVTAPSCGQTVATASWKCRRRLAMITTVSMVMIAVPIVARI